MANNETDQSPEPRSSRVWAAFKNEFRKENLSLSFEKNTEFMKKDPEEVLAYFHSSMWPCLNGSIVYIVYRVFIAIYYTIWFVESIVRNYEFRAQNFYITNKKKTNLLLLHPWPFYMTSWSLTILFIHLWISAFIVLYFYSINQKTLLARFFTCLFGPFSCSKANNRARVVSNNMPLTRPDLAELEHLNSAKNTCKIATIIELDPPKRTDESQSGTSQPLRNITYCVNKSNCQLPSSTVTSNAEAWKLWVDTHVPNVVLVLIKVSWLLYNQIVITAIVVTIGYFTYVIIMDIEAEPTWIAEVGNLHRHGINSLVAIIDLVILAYPVRILHFLYTSLYGWTYAVVTFMYWMQNPKENIVYEQIDYNKPFLIFFYYMMLTMLTFLMQTFHFFAYQLKLYLKEKYLLVKKNCFSSTSG